jgi:DNA replication protein DnaC
VNLCGPPGSGKTSVGLQILHDIWDIEPLGQSYWTEQDFLADLRNLWRLEEMTQKSVRDDVLWGEYVEWERRFWAYKETSYLFLDDIGHCYTPMQWYEVEGLIRFRYNKHLPTMFGTTDSDLKTMPDRLKSLVFRNVVTITLEAR